jgi:Ca2+-binding RTX toxin-like protein
MKMWGLRAGCPAINQLLRSARTLCSLTLALFALIAPAGAQGDAVPLTCEGKVATLVSNEPQIEGTEGHDVIIAGAGDNEVYGLGGNDTICGSDGDDTIYGGRGNDTVDGGPGRDRVFGENGNDRLSGAADDEDMVDGGPGDDRVSGGPGNFDLVVGGAGRDQIDGGPGVHDIASYETAGGAVEVHLGAGSVRGAEREQLTEIEDALGGSGEDVLIGAASTPNRLDGGPGDDRLVGAGPGDRAYGGPGGDDCSGQFASRLSCGVGAGRDRTAVDLYRSIGDTNSLVISGSRRANHVVVSSNPAGYVVSSHTPGVGVRLGERDSNSCSHAARPLTIVCAGAVNSILASLGPGADTLTVAANVPATVAAVIDGGGGSDELRGGAGDDTIYGGDDRAPDTLVGEGGDDVIFGINIFHPRLGSGAARMLGGAGNDLLIGGQPCEGDYFEGGLGDRDSASFARVRNSGTAVVATIGGPVSDPDVAGCHPGRIERSVEKIEGSPGPDQLYGDNGPNWLLGRGGDDFLEGRGGYDRCVGGAGSDGARGCEVASSVP